MATKDQQVPFAQAATEYVVKEQRRRKTAPQRILVGPSGLAVADSPFGCREFPTLEALLTNYGLRVEDLGEAA